jgi:dienelactone hydrolase
VFEAGPAPLDPRFEPPRALPGATLRGVSYASGGEGDRVTAWLVVPEAPRPHAGVLFLHWGFGSRDSFLPEALALARSGAVSLLPNAPGFGGRRGPRPLFGAAAPARAYAEQAVRELRRGLDFLAALENVDAERLAFVGHSLGASVGGQLAGADARVRAAVLAGGTGAISRLWLPRASPEERAALAELDAVAWIGRARAACLFQFGTQDEWIAPADAEAYAAAAPEPKRLCWYPSDHAFDAAARLGRATFLAEPLRLGPLDEAALALAALPRGERVRYRLARPFVALARRFARAS